MKKQTKEMIIDVIVVIGFSIVAFFTYIIL